MQAAISTSPTLTQEQVIKFIAEGYVVVRKAFHRDTAAQLLPHVWARLSEDPNDPSTWKNSYAQIEDVIYDGPVQDIFTSRFRSSVDELVGAGRWTTRQGFGWVILRFPGFAGSVWERPTSGWHVDGIDYQHHVTSPEIGLVGIEFLTDIKPGGGGPAIRVGSHKAISRLLNKFEPQGVTYLQLRAIAEELKGFRVVEVVGDAGDVVWLHPHVIHARSPNVQRTIRVAANRSIVLNEPLNLKREREEDYSPVERAILEALDEGF